MKLKSGKFIFIILIINCSLLIAQMPTQEWVARYSGISSSGSSGQSVKLDSSGNVYVLAPVSTSITLSDFCVIKYSPTGTFMWQAIYNSPGNLGDISTAFAVTRAGDVYITGSSGINFDYHLLTVKFNSNGLFQWARNYNAGGPGDGANDIVLDKQGNTIITGVTAINSNTAYGLTIKYNFNGDSLWVRKFAQYQYSINNKMVVDDSSNIYTTGYHVVNTMQDNYLTLKYNQTGNLVWYSSYGLSPIGGIATTIAIDSNRNVYAAGNMYTLNPSYSDNALIKINPNGTILWSRIYTGLNGNNGVGQPSGMAVIPDGSGIYYTTFCANGMGGGASDIIVLKYTSAGDTVWTRRYGGGVFGTQNAPGNLKLDKNGNIYVTGTAYYTASGDDYVTIKYLPNGTQQWLAAYNGPLTNSGDHAHDLIIDTNLFVYVTGISSRQNNPILWDAATIKYNQTLGISTNGNTLPQKFMLEQNYPNPFNSTTVISYALPKKINVRLLIYTITGQFVKSLVNSQQNPGYYSIAYNAEDLSSGVYFYTLLSDDLVIETKKFVLVK